MPLRSRVWIPLFAFVLGCWLVLGATASAQQDIAAQVLERINQARAGAGLPPLVRNALLDAAAQGHAEDILRSGSRIGHRGTDGSNIRQRIARVGYTGSPVGENWAGYRSLDVTMEFWLTDPPHARNILNPRYVEIGIGVVPRSHGGFVVVTDFGGPSAPAEARAEPLQPPAQPAAQPAVQAQVPTEIPPPVEPTPPPPPPPTEAPVVPTTVPTPIPPTPLPPTLVALAPPNKESAQPLKGRAKAKRLVLRGYADNYVGVQKGSGDSGRMYWGGILAVSGVLLLGVAVVGHRRHTSRWR
jgi:hypothetical protein